ncbi:MAG: FapA family protein [Candidatus Wallbacteria bacterium]|nr:FapA family protein [Candidatus Wallbacteria bacterium]
MGKAKSVIVEGPSIEECIKTACDNLNCRKEDVNFEVLAEGKKGLFGLVSKPYKIRVICVQQDSMSEEEKIDKVLNDVQNIDVNINGFCEVKRDNDGIFLVVYRPQGEGYRVTLEQAAKLVEESGIVNADFDAISEAVNKADEVPVRIADFDPAIYKDGEVQIVLSKDLMSAEMILLPPKGGNAVNVDQVISSARDKGIQVDLMMAGIKEAVESRNYNRQIRIAEGRNPINGQDASIEYKFASKKEKLSPAIREDGGVDFKKLDLIDNVVKGEILGEKVPCTTGEPGVNILGETVPAQPGRDMILTPGKNVAVSEDGTKLIAEIDGQVNFKKNVINILPVFVVPGDLDLSVGDIDFVGNVIVKESIRDGFEVKCKGDLEVGKSIGASRIEATGDVVVKGGILGKDKGVIRSGGSIIAKFIESCTCEAKEQITVERAIMHSKIRARRIQVTSSKGGLIVGGEIQAEDEVEAITIGSNLATKTSIVMGISKEILVRLNELEKSCDDTAKNLNKINQALAIFVQLKERTGELNEENTAKMTKTLNLKKQLDSSLKELGEEKTKLEEQLESVKGGRVRVQKVIFPGVTITIGKGILQVKDEIKYATLVYEEGYVKIKPYD